MDKHAIERIKTLLQHVDYDIQQTQETYGAQSLQSKEALEQFGIAWLTLKKLRPEQEFLSKIS